MNTRTILPTTVGLPVEESLRRLSMAGVIVRVEAVQPSGEGDWKAGEGVGLRGWVIRETDAGQLGCSAPVKMVLVASVTCQQSGPV